MPAACTTRARRSSRTCSSPTAAASRCRASSGSAGSPRRTSSSATGRRSWSATPTSARSKATAWSGSCGRWSGSPQPHHFISRARGRRRRAGQGPQTRSRPSSASSSTLRDARRSRNPPSRLIPRRRWCRASVTRGAAGLAARARPRSSPRGTCARTATPRAPASTPAPRRLAVDEVVVGAHRLALLGAAAPWSSARRPRSRRARTRGHQRGRWCGSDTRATRPPGGADETVRRVVGTAPAYSPS